MASPGLIRRTYDSLALVAVLNVVGVAALVGFLVKSGALSAEKFRALAMVIRGEGVVVPPEADADHAADSDPGTPKTEATKSAV